MRARALACGMGCAWALAGCLGSSGDSSPPAGPYQLAASYSRQHNGQALLVVEGSQVVYEDDENGATADTPFQIYSGTKSFTCALAAAAVQDGLLASLDETVATTITEWQSDSRKSQITVRELLNMTSGISQSLLNVYDLVLSGGFSASVPAVADPGTVFAYGETSIDAFEELMSRKLGASATFAGLDPLAYFKQRVLDPIGLSYAFWMRNAQGQPILSFGAVVSANQWVKYGELLRDHGSFGGNQVVPSAGIDPCTTASGVFAGYGLGLWLNGAMPAGFSGISLAQFGSVSFRSGGPTGLIAPGASSALFAAVGLTDHRMYIDRSQNRVIVRMGHGGITSDWNDADFYALLP
jgi:CubicO group peptidase (beta-lactamase class C family)